MMSARPTTADSVVPPAMLLASVMRSGETPKCSIANILPVRAKPVWISSAISTMPFASHNSRSQATACACMTLNPPSPCTGSNTIAATLEGSMSHLNTCSIACLTVSSEAQWQGNGTW